MHSALCTLHSYFPIYLLTVKTMMMMMMMPAARLIVLSCLAAWSPFIMAQRGGICYDPVHVGPESFSAETVANDMAQIRASGFTHVRTYKSSYGDIEMGPIITQAGLQAVLGVPLKGQSVEEIQKQLMAAIQAGKNGHATIIFVGNENLADQASVPAQMLESIQYVKDNVPDSVRVGTVQRNTEFLDPARQVEGFEALLKQCQIVGVNIHPFFTPKLNVNAAITNVNDQWNGVLSKYSGIENKLALTEVGWPSGGDAANTYGTPEGAEKFFNDFEHWSAKAIPSSEKKYYFQMYDQPYKAAYAPAFETNFGVFKADGTSKFSLPGQISYTPEAGAGAGAGAGAAVSPVVSPVVPVPASPPAILLPVVPDANANINAKVNTDANANAAVPVVPNTPVDASTPQRIILPSKSAVKQQTFRTAASGKVSTTRFAGSENTSLTFSSALLIVASIFGVIAAAAFAIGYKRQQEICIHDPLSKHSFIVQFK